MDIIFIFLMTVQRCVKLKELPYQTQNFGEQRINGAYDFCIGVLVLEFTFNQEKAFSSNSANFRFQL